MGRQQQAVGNELMTVPTPPVMGARWRPVTVRRTRWLQPGHIQPWWWVCCCGSTGHHTSHTSAIRQADDHARICPTARRTR